MTDDELREIFYAAYRRSIHEGGGSYWTAHGAGLRAVADSVRIPVDSGTGDTPDQ